MPADALSPSLRTENDASNISEITITDSTMNPVNLSTMKIITLDNGESVQLQKLPNAWEGKVKLYNTSIELGQYDTLPWDLTITTVVNPTQLEYSFEAENGKPFARIVLIDSASGQQVVVPVLYEGPKTDLEATDLAPKTDVKDVKAAETGIEMVYAGILAIIAAGATFLYRKIND